MTAPTWLWYNSKTTFSVALDAARYRTMDFDGRPIPRPDWVCRAPNSGVHVDGRIGPIDVHVVGEPTAGVELNWTRPFSVTIVKLAWFDLISDLIYPSRIFVGQVFAGDAALENWRTLHGLHQPPLLSKKMETSLCPTCGLLMTWPLGGAYFEAKDIAEELVLVNGNGVFVREDRAAERHLRRPNGTYKPSRVVWRPGP